MGGGEEDPTVPTLRSAGIGLWRLDRATGDIDADALCGELLGLPSAPVRLTRERLRSRLHRADADRLRPAVRLAAVQQRPVDLRVRVVDDAGTVVRVLRVRIAPAPADDPGHTFVGTAAEEIWADSVDDYTVPPPTTATADDDPRDVERRQVDALNRAPGPGTPPPPAQPEPSGEPPAAPAAPDRPLLAAGRLLDPGHALAEPETIDDVLRIIAALDLPGFTIDSQLIAVPDEGRLSVIDSTGFPDGDYPFNVTMDSTYPGVEAVRTAHPVLLESPDEYRRRYPAVWPLISHYGRRAWAYYPLVSGGRTLGCWMIGLEHPTRFTADRRAVLATLARTVSHALERARTNEADRALSLGLLRSMQPRSHGTPGLTAAARYVPTGGGLLVGGDWCDVVDLPDGRLAVVIGDVEGHDAHAATIMSQLRTAVLAYALEGHQPDAVLTRASRFLSDLGSDRYATCMYVRADPATGILDIARAGHPHPVLRMPDGTCLLRHIQGGLPLGMSEFSTEDYPIHQLRMQLGEILMLCTDGLIENGGYDYYSGWPRVRDALSPRPVDDLEKVADRLVEAVHGPASHSAPGSRADRRDDDITLVLLRRAAVDDPHRATSRRTILTIDQDEQERITGARHELRDILHDWAVEDHVDTAVLLVSELLANVLVHTEGGAAVEAYLTGPRGARTLHVEVSDRSDELPHRRTPGEMASSGRGMLLVETLADRWGVQPLGEGKSIWFEIDEDRADAPEPRFPTESIADMF